ncbi:MAG: family 43 glycosylhydrolase [Bacteroidales bacterium]|nr:family 43 glycosylhydrolase [Bacteroidales bacterium]
MKKTLITLALLLAATVWAGAQLPKPAEQDAAPITVFMMGDSTMAEKDLTKGTPERGWGTMLQNFFDHEVRVANYALNGRSTTSFIHEGRWNIVRDNIKPGDYVVIQFGHNDSKAGEHRFAGAFELYQQNLARFIDTVRVKGGIPIILSPVTRRTYNDGVLALNTVQDYPAAAKDIAEKKDAIFIDMYSATYNWIKALGDEASKPYYMWLDPGKYDSHPNGSKDNTHTPAVGALRICTFFVDSLKVKVPELGRHIAHEDFELFHNPIINADYSDPDVIAVDGEYWMTSSSFDQIPGLQILHSYDLVNWEIVGAALRKQVPEETFNSVQHGNGVWAPCIRYHDGMFYIFWGDPDFGIYQVHTTDPRGQWSDPVLVLAGKGLIDTSPLWDDDGRVYLVHGWANSRAGFNGVLDVCELNEDCTAVIGEQVSVFNGNETGNRTLEGPKFYKRNGWYYIMAPAGGVSTGWQLVMRSRNVYGPYECRRVLQQGNGYTKAPHQGGWVTDAAGDDWFIHFEDRGPYGRVVHLQPVWWGPDDWCYFGRDTNLDGVGEPVSEYRYPAVASRELEGIPAASMRTDFTHPYIPLNWQWQANPQINWAMPNPGKGCLRLNCVGRPEGWHSLWQSPNVLSTKAGDTEFTFDTKMEYRPGGEGERVGLIVLGQNYGTIEMEFHEGAVKLVRRSGNARGETLLEETAALERAMSYPVHFRVVMRKGALCNFYYSLDGEEYKEFGPEFAASKGQWIGAKVGFFAISATQRVSSGYVEVY